MKVMEIKNEYLVSKITELDLQESSTTELLTNIDSITSSIDPAKLKYNEDYLSINTDLCEIGLQVAIPNIYIPIKDEEIATFAVLGQPENLLITAKNILQPGFGMLKFKNQYPLVIWAPLAQQDQISLHQIYYLMNQSVLKIYLGNSTYDKLSSDFIRILNTNRKPLILPASELPKSMHDALEGEIVDIYKF